MAEFRNHGPALVPHDVRCRLARVTFFLEHLGDFRAHVVLVMLGENLFCQENSVRHQFAVGDHALPFFKEVGQYAGVGHGDNSFVIGYLENGFEAAGFALKAAIDDQSAEPERLTNGYFARETKPSFRGVVIPSCADLG